MKDGQINSAERYLPEVESQTNRTRKKRGIDKNDCSRNQEHVTRRTLWMYQDREPKKVRLTRQTHEVQKRIGRRLHADL